MKRKIAAILIAAFASLCAFSPAYAADETSIDANSAIPWQDVNNTNENTKNEPEAEAAARAVHNAVITVNDGTYSAPRGGQLIIDDTNYTLEADTTYWPRAQVNGKFTLSGADTYEIFYRNLGIVETTGENNSLKYSLCFYIPRDIPEGEYRAEIDMSNRGYDDYDKAQFTGSFTLNVEPSDKTPVKISSTDGANEITVSYGDSYNISVSDENATPSAPSCLKSETENKIYLTRGGLDYSADIKPGKYSLSELLEYHDYVNDTSEAVFSDSIPLTITEPEHHSAVQDGPAELCGSYTESRTFKCRIPFSEPITISRSLYNRYIKVCEKNSGELIPMMGLNYELYPEYAVGGPEQVTVEGIDISSVSGTTGSVIEPGEYIAYLYLDGHEVGPIEFNYYDYAVEQLYYSTFSGAMNIKYNFSISNYPFSDKSIAAADITIKADDGDTIVEMTSFPRSYYEGSALFNFNIPTPSVPKTGQYLLETTVRFTDGETLTLLPRHILIGEYYIPSQLYVNHENLTPDTKSIDVSLGFESYIEDMNDIYITLCDENGNEIGRSDAPSAVTIAPSEAIYSVKLSKAPTVGTNYYLELYSYSGREFSGPSTARIFETKDVPTIIDINRTDVNTFDIIIENLTDGTYPVYKNTDEVGTLTIDKSGRGELFISEWSAINGTVFLKLDNFSRLIEISLPEYKPARINTGYEFTYLASSVKEIKDMTFRLECGTMAKPEDIISLRLIADGSVIAEAENIRSDGSSITQFGKSCIWLNSFKTDFANVDLSALGGDRITLSAVTTFGTAEFEILVVDENVPYNYLYSRLNVATIVRYDETSMTYCAPSSDISFTLDNPINFTEGVIELLEYSDDPNEFPTVAAAMQLSELDKTDSGGLYIYSGHFKNIAKPGKEYAIIYYNESLQDQGIASSEAIIGTGSFFAADKAMINDPPTQYYEILVGSDKFETYIGAINISENDKITARFEYGDITAEIPVTAVKADDSDAFVNTYKFTFDFSGIQNFKNNKVHILVNGEDQTTLPLTDKRGGAFAESCDIIGRGDSERLEVNGFNLSGSEIGLKIFAVDTIGLTGEVLGDEAANVSAVAESDDRCEFDIGAMSLPEGKYIYQLYLDGKPLALGSDRYFTIGSNSPNDGLPLVIADSAVSGGAALIDIINVTDADIDTDIIVAAYDRNGALLSMSEPTHVTVTAGSELTDISVDAAPNAVIYKVFAWDGTDNLKPIAKSNLNF